MGLLSDEGETVETRKKQKRKQSHHLASSKLKHLYNKRHRRQSIISGKLGIKWVMIVLSKKI